MRKKWLAMVLALVFVALTAACNAQPSAENGGARPKNGKKEKQDTLVVCLESEAFFQNSEINSRMYNYIQPECDRIVFERLPAEGLERDTYCDRLRMELMAGGGPDVFIVGCTNLWDGCLFPNIEKTMRGGYFLPLDDYMEKWETDLFKRQAQVIMDAGKTEEGQVVLPLLYTLPIYVFYENKTIEEEGPFDTWEKMEAAAQKDESIAWFLGARRSFWFPQRFGALGDYDAEKITLSMETMETLLRQAASVEQKESSFDQYTAGSGDEGVILEEDTYEHLYLQIGMPLAEGGREELMYSEDRSALAVYNTEGGLTATITAFAVVNRNTMYPEDAVKVASVLYNDLFQNALKWNYLGNSGLSSWSFTTDETYTEDLKPYLEQVNAVRFYSELEGMLSTLGFEALTQDPTKLAEKELSRMKMIMAE